MAGFGRRKIELLRQFMPLKNGVPSHDVFSDVFRMLDPQEFERVFRQFVAPFAKSHGLDLSGVLAEDGKSLWPTSEASRIGPRLGGCTPGAIQLTSPWVFRFGCGSLDASLLFSGPPSAAEM